MTHRHGVTLAELIEVIERRQPVINKDALTKLDKQVSGIAALDAADGTQVAFVAQKKYLPGVIDTIAGVILISKAFACEAKIPTDTQPIIVSDAYLAYASISTLFTPPTKTGIHPTAVIDHAAKLGEGVSVAAHAVIGAGTDIGAGTHIGAGSVIGDNVTIGSDCHIEAQATIAHDCVLGDGVRIHSHASIGSEGFGFAPAKGGTGIEWQRIAQLGRVIIGNQVRVGANSCIDRGAVGDTIIGDFVIIDNLVQIAHNVQIGAGTAMAAKVAIAGSTSIGRNCIIGGAVGISGHLSICDGVTITAMSMVISDIKESGSYSSGTVAMPTHNWRRAALKFRKLGDKSSSAD